MEGYPSDPAGVYQLAPEEGSQLDPAAVNPLGQAGAVDPDTLRPYPQ